MRPPRAGAMLTGVALTCLIVDDNPGFITAARQLLERQGIDVVGVASSCDEAVRRAYELRPDVILVDVDLGAESGFDVARRLAEADGLTELRVVLISMYAEKDFTDLISASPAIGFVSKPSLSASAIYDVLGGAAA
jgi:DNA-binding NarL/FixJ family response regulator